MFGYQIRHITNYLKRNKLTSFVNLLGLMVGFAIFLILGLYIKYETSYDTCYAQTKETYRLIVTTTPPHGDKWTGRGIPAPLRAEIQNQIPEAVSVGRLFRSSEEVFQYQDKVFEEAEAYYADQDMIDILDIRLIKQNKEFPLEPASSMIMSESTARRYFGNDDPLGKIIRLPWGNIEVSGIYKDLPGNIHARPDLMISYESPWWIKLYNDDKWNFFWLSYYMTIQPGSDPGLIARKITRIFETVDDPTNDASKKEIELQAISDIHFGNIIPNEPNTSDIRVIKALKGIAFFILIIVLINYINLSSAQILERSTQVSVRKVLGISRMRIIANFTSEATLFQLTALLLAFIVVYSFIPAINTFLNCQLSFALFSMRDWGLFILLLLSSIAITVSYPVIIMLSFDPVTCLKGKFMPSSHSAIIRKGLIGFQFFISFALIFGTLIFFRQSDYLIHKDIGMQTGNMLVIKSGHANWNSFPAKKKLFKTETETHPGVYAVSNSNSIPGIGSYIDFLRNINDGDEKLTNFSIFDTDYDFIKTMGIQMIAGRELSEEYGTDAEGAIISRNGLKELGFSSAEEALGQRLISDFDKREMEIVGICEDFKLSNLNGRGYPYLIRILENQNRFITIRYLPGYDGEIVRMAKDKWKLVFNDIPFRYFYLDENYRAVYASEVFQTRLITLFSILAVILAALGLFGMTYFIVIKREKEFSIRKVNGAAVYDVFALVSKDFIKLIIMSSLLAIPLSWWLSQLWLGNYANHIEMNWWYCLIPFSLLGMVTLFTISYHTLKTARVNPAKLLRNE